MLSPAPARRPRCRAGARRQGRGTGRRALIRGWCSCFRRPFRHAKAIGGMGSRLSAAWTRPGIPQDAAGVALGEGRGRRRPAAHRTAGGAPGLGAFPGRWRLSAEPATAAGCGSGQSGSTAGMRRTACPAARRTGLHRQGRLPLPCPFPCPCPAFLALAVAWPGRAGAGATTAGAPGRRGCLGRGCCRRRRSCRAWPSAPLRRSAAFRAASAAACWAVRSARTASIGDLMLWWRLKDTSPSWRRPIQPGRQLVKELQASPPGPWRLRPW